MKKNLQQVIACFFLVGILSFQVIKILPAMNLPWWFNTDEIFYFSEVIRFLSGNLHQTYFDIPGTPLMALSALSIYLIWAPLELFGLTIHSNPSDFAIFNLQNLAVVMRSMTLFFSCMSIFVCFRAIYKATNILTGIGAAILTVSLPIFIHYSQFVRSESFGLVLCFAAWLVIQASSSQSLPKAYLLAGAMCGLAMAARFHFALVGPPLLLGHWLAAKNNQQSKNAKCLEKITLFLFGAFFIASIYALLVRTGCFSPSDISDAMLISSRDASGQRLSSGLAPPEVLHATGMIYVIWIILGSVSGVFLTAKILWHSGFIKNFDFDPLACSALLGFSGGFLFGHPTFLWGGYHHLQSIAFYSAWHDADLAALSPFLAWWKVTAYYFDVAFPELWLKACFGIGFLLILFRGRPEYMPLGFLTIACFLAHPPKMKMWDHHIIPWLPALSAVAMLPIGSLWQQSAGLATSFRKTAAFGVVIAILIFVLQPRFKQASSYYEVSRDRIRFIQEAEKWLVDQQKSGEALLFGYYAMNQDCFYLWLEDRGIKIPQAVSRDKKVEVWWLNKEKLAGRKGLIVMSPADIVFFFKDLEIKAPGQQVNPLVDTRFQKVASFGGGFYEIKILRFDFSKEKVLQ